MIVKDDPLEKEKVVYFWLIVLSEALPMLFIMLGGLLSGDASAVFFVLIVGVIVGIKIFVVYWIIMGDTVWIKWLTIVLNSIWVLFLLLAIIVGGQEVQYSLSSTSYALDTMENSFIDFLMRVYCTLLVGWAGWFISILFRDIKKLGGISNQRGNADPLLTEKIYYFGTHLLTGIIIAVVGVSFSNEIPEFYDLTAAAIVLGLFFVEAVQLGVIWLVLFGRVIWFKWCCGGCVGAVAILSLLITLGFFGLDQVATGTSKVVVGTLNLGMGIWLVYLLWRDIKGKHS